MLDTGQMEEPGSENAGDNTREQWNFIALVASCHYNWIDLGTRNWEWLVPLLNKM